MVLEIFTTDHSLLHEMGAEHLEAPKRIRIIRQALEDQKALPIKLKKGKQIKRKQLEVIHSKALIDLVESSRTHHRLYLTPDTLTNRHTWQAALYSAGTSYHVGLRSFKKKRIHFAMTRPPGHHATGGVCMGFCFFNNIALTAELLLQRKEISKVAILDIDQHHGNGTQDLFYDRDDVLYMSLHLDPEIGFPHTGYLQEVGEGKGVGRNINIPLPKDTPDSDYQVFMDEVVLPILREYKADMLLISLGLDALEGDPYGGLGLTVEGYYSIGHRLSVLLPDLHSRIAVLLEGGYKYDELGEATVAFFHGLLHPKYPEAKRKLVGPALTSSATDRLLRTVKGIQRNYWLSL